MADGFDRDDETGAILNRNNEGLAEYRSRRHLQREIANLRREVDELKELLEKMLNTRGRKE